MKTYGTCTYSKTLRIWEIACEPHVALRLKRWFARIDTYQFGIHRLTATPENCRDLEAFLTRYPMTVLPSEFLKEQADKHRERQTLVEQIMANTSAHQEFVMKLPPREYQSIAANLWLAAGGLLLADDVGLGKTASSFCGFTKPFTLPALVVTLSHLPPQWTRELAKFTDLTSHVLKKGTPYDMLRYTKGKVPDVIITNYHKLAGWAETLAPVVNSVVFDEVQELRHDGTGKYRAAKHICNNVQFRLGLSATPIYNYGGEIWNVLDCLCPDSLGDWEEFRREWCSYEDQKPIIKDPAAFSVFARQTGLMLRRTRKEVKRELPEVIVVPQTIDCDPNVLNKMQGKAIELAKLILKQGQDFQGQKMQASGQFDMITRQATGVAKAPFVADFVRFLVEENDTPVVLYGWHREVYSIWMERLKGDARRGIKDLNPVMYTGSESPKQKEEAKQAFLSGKSKVLIISLRAGAGMDGLQDVCHMCVFGELDWSPGVHEQCIGRIHRDGQDEPVVAYYLVCDSGSDPVVSDVLGIKKQQIDGIRDPNQDLVTQLQVDPDHIKRLAEKFLTDHGVPIPKAEPEKSEEIVEELM